MTDIAVSLGNPWQRFLARGQFEVVLWAIAAVSWIYLVIRTGGDLLAITVWSVPFLLVISGLSLPWRSISFGTVVVFFMLGMGPMFLVSAIFGALFGSAGIEGFLRDVFGGLGITFVGRDLVAPFTEELFKVLPLLVVFMWRPSGLRTSTGPLDMAVLAGATGAGLAFAEDIFVFIAQGLPGPVSDLFALRLGPIYAGIVGSEPGFTTPTAFTNIAAFFYPEMQDLSGVVWSGHGALATGIGLALGLGLWWRRTTGSRAFYPIPVVVFFWAVWEHVMANWYGGAACSSNASLLCTLSAIDLHGRLYPIVILIGWLYAIWLSREVLSGHRAADSTLELPWSKVNRQAYRGRGWRGWVGMVRDRLDFLRMRRKTGYGAFHLEHSETVTVGQAFGVLATRTETLVIKERQLGETPTAIPTAVRTAIDQVSPID